MSALKDVKQGDVVVYEINGVQRNAVSQSSPWLGYNSGRRSASFHLNLTYLEENGSAVRVVGAQLLTKAASDEELAEIAKISAAQHHSPSHEKLQHEDTAWLAAHDDATKAEVLRLKSQPVTIGWRPHVDGEEIAALKAEASEIIHRVINERDEARKQVDELQAKLDSFAVQPMPPSSPSAADLDAHAEEQKAAEATGGVPAPATE